MDASIHDWTDKGNTTCPSAISTARAYNGHITTRTLIDLSTAKSTFSATNLNLNRNTK